MSIVQRARELQDIMDEINRGIREALEHKPGPAPEWPAVVTTSVFDAINYLERQYDRSILGMYARRLVEMIDKIRRTEGVEFGKLERSEEGSLVLTTWVTLPEVADHVDITFTL
jgi:hypothetical protein